MIKVVMSINRVISIFRTFCLGSMRTMPKKKKKLWSECSLFTITHLNKIVSVTSNKTFLSDCYFLEPTFHLEIHWNCFMKTWKVLEFCLVVHAPMLGWICISPADGMYNPTVSKLKSACHSLKEKQDIYAMELYYEKLLCDAVVGKQVFDVVASP